MLQLRRDARAQARVNIYLMMRHIDYNLWACVCVHVCRKMLVVPRIWRCQNVPSAVFHLNTRPSMGNSRGVSLSLSCSSNPTHPTNPSRKTARFKLTVRHERTRIEWDWCDEGLSTCGGCDDVCGSSVCWVCVLQNSARQTLDIMRTTTTTTTSPS